ncbi:MAG TPA: endonuclease/exonuclease/phosphatase family protein [Kineosporiaceae bacterium]|nr:endonuclease/exonuclease/phosphatase family protein [Kineosporiaceae bacterium]
MNTVRLLSWNVWKLLGDPLAVHRVLRAAEPDLVCLQEAPALLWSTRQLSALARASGLHLVAGGRSAAGNAILRSSRMQVLDAEAFRFRPLNWRIQRRGAVLATVGLPGELPLRLAGVHLGLDPGERQAHAQELRDRLSISRRPVVVAGDLNELPGGPSWQTLASVAADPVVDAAATFTVARPRKRIDAVLTGPGVEIIEYGQWQPDLTDAARASDHLPVLAVIRPARPDSPVR